MEKVKNLRKTLALFFAMVMLFLTGSSVFMYAGVFAEENAASQSGWDSTARTVNLVQSDGFTAGVKNPATPATSTQGWANNGDASYFYFGNYFQSNSQTKEPLKWRVLNKASSSTKGAADSFMLMTDQIIDYVLFNENVNTYAVEWKDSNLRTWLNSGQYEDPNPQTGKLPYTSGGFFKTAFNATEQNAVKDTSWPAGPLWFTFDSPAVNEKVFLLAAEDMDKTQYGFYHFGAPGIVQSTTCMVATAYARLKGVQVNNSGFSNYYLRSVTPSALVEGEYYPSMVVADGSYFAELSDTSDSEIGTLDDFDIGNPEIAGVAPVLHLGWDSVLFISEHGAETPATFAKTNTSNTKEWDVTLDNGDKAVTATLADTDKAKVHLGADLEINIDGITEEKGYDRISAMLVNSSGAVVAYGPISQTATNGAHTFTLPSDLDLGAYTLKVFAENTGYGSSQQGSDYASTPVDISLTIIPKEQGAALSLNYLGDHSAVYGDDLSGTTTAIIMDNIGTEDAEIIDVAVSPAESFEVIAGDKSVPVDEQNTSWKVKAKENLDAGTYIGTVTVTYRRGTQEITVATEMKVTISPKPVQIKILPKEQYQEGTDWEKDPEEQYKIHMWETLVWNVKDNVWRGWDSNWANSNFAVYGHKDDPDYDYKEGVDLTWDGPMDAVYIGVDGEKHYATVLYDNFPYEDYPTGLHSKRFSLSVQVDDPNYVRIPPVYGDDIGYTTLDFNHGLHEDGTPEVPEPPPPPVQDFWINYDTETVTLLMDSSETYHIHIANTQADFMGEEIRNGDSITRFINNPNEERAVVYMRVTEDAAGVPSKPTAISIPLRPARPTDIGSEKTSGPDRKDGKLTNVKAGMEYRLKGSETWEPVYYDGEIENLSAGTYEVRYRAKVDGQADWDEKNQKLFNNEFASAAQEVVIVDGEQTGAVMNVSAAEAMDGLLLFDPCQYADIPYVTSKQIVVKNSGTEAGTIDDIVSANGNYAWKDVNDADKVIEAGQSKTYNLNFSANAKAGTYYEKLIVKYDGTEQVESDFYISSNVSKSAYPNSGAVAAPVVQSKTATTVTLAPGDNNGYGTPSYGIVESTGIRWQKNDPAFTNLNPDTTYQFKIKFDGGTNYYESGESQPISVTTEKADQFGMTISGDIDFGTVKYGATPEAREISIQNTGTAALNNVSVAVTAGDSSAFTVQNGDGTINAGDKNTTWKLTWPENLAAGNYTATVTVSAAGVPNDTFTATLVVEKADQAAPAKPAEENVTARSITLQPQAPSDITGMAVEYRIKEKTADWKEDWQDSVEFGSLKPNTEYQVQARYKGSDNYLPSDASEAADFTTNKIVLSFDGTLTASSEYGVTMQNLTVDANGASVTNDLGETVAGAWVWVDTIDANERPAVQNTKTYQAKFVPNENAGQYEKLVKDVTVTITPKMVTVTIVGDEIQNITEIKGLTAHYNDVDSRQIAATVLYNNSDTLPDAVGDYPVTVRIDDTNYQAETVNGPQKLTIQLTPQADAPADPQQQTVTARSITVVPQHPSAAGTPVQYRIREINGQWQEWQEAATFNDLTPNTAYEVQARYAGNENYQPSGVSNAVSIQTGKVTLIYSGTLTSSAVYGTAATDLPITEDGTAVLDDLNQPVAGRWVWADSVTAQQRPVVNGQETYTAKFVPDANAGQYNELTKEITPQITPKQVVITVKGNEIQDVADIQPLTAEYQDVDGNLQNATVLYDGKTDLPSAAGDYAISARIDDNANYQVESVTGIKTLQIANGALEQAKKNAETTINSFIYLSDEQKAQFIASVKAASAVQDVESIVQQAETANGEAEAIVTEERTTAREEIAKLMYLEETVREQYIANVDTVYSVEEVKAIVTAAQSENAKVQQEVDTAKEQAKQQIAGMEYLTDEEKTTYTEQVNGAYSLAAVQEAVTNAGNTNTATKEKVDTAAAQARTDIAGMEYLSDTQRDTYTAQIDNARSVEEVEQAVTEAAAANETTKQAVEAERTRVQTEIENLLYLDSTTKDEYIAQLAGAFSVEKVKEIETNAKNADAQVQQEVDTAKATAKEELKKLLYLTKEQQSAYSTQIDQAYSVEAVEQAVTEAAAVNETTKTEVDKARTTAKEAIAGMQYLSLEQQSAYQTRVDGVYSVAEVEAIQAEAQAENDKLEAAALLVQAKETAKAQLDTFTYLDTAAVTEYKNRIDQANDIDTVNAIAEEARIENEELKSAAEALQQKQAEAKAEIGKMTYLTDTARQEFIAQVEAADTIEKVEQILQNAKAANTAAQEALVQKQTEAKETVNQMPYLSQQQKQDYGSKIDAALTITAVEEIVQQATTTNEETQKEVEAKRETAKTEIENMLYLSDRQKADFNQEIDNAYSVAAVESVVQKAAQANTTAQGTVEGERAAAKQKIVDMPYLTTEEKAGFDKDIDAAYSVEEVTAVVTRAQETNAATQAKVEAERTTANDKIADMQYLTVDEKADYTAKVNAAYSVETVQAVLAQANAVNDAARTAVEAARTAAKADVAAMPYLTEEEQATFNANIDNAYSVTAVQAIVAQAQNTNANTETLVAAARTAAKGQIAQLLYLSEQEAESYHTEIDNAYSVAAVQAIAQKAQEANTAAEMLVTAERTAANEQIAAMLYLTADERTAYSTEISNAYSVNAVQAVIAKAQSANAATEALVTAERATAEEQLTAMLYLTADERTAYSASVGSAYSVAAVQEVIAQAQKVNAATETLVAAERATAEEQLTAMLYLTADERTAYSASVGSSYSVAAVRAVVTQAQNTNAATQVVVEDRRAAAKVQVSAMPYLSEQAKATYYEAIETSFSVSAVDTVLQNAYTEHGHLQYQAELLQSKNAAILAIHGLELLSAEIKTQFIQRVEQAQTKEEVQAVLTEARQYVQNNNALQAGNAMSAGQAMVSSGALDMPATGDNSHLLILTASLLSGAVVIIIAGTCLLYKKKWSK